MSLLAKAHKNLFLSLRDKVGCLGLSKAWDRKGCEFLRGIKASDIWGQLFTQILTQTAVLCKQWALGILFKRVHIIKCPFTTSF